MNRVGFLAAGLAAVSMFSAANGFSQAQQAQNRIPQQVVINGLTVNAASVLTPAGQIQSYTCSSPQHYSTSDGSSQGWACYEETTGVWLLHAVPPAQTQAAPPRAAPPVLPQPVQPQAPVYQQASPTVYQPAQAPVYRPAPLPSVVYQQPPTVIYQTPPAVIYQQASVIYAQPVRPVVVVPAYPSSVLLGAAAINAVGTIASAAIVSSYYYPRTYYYTYNRGRGRRW